MCCMTRRTISFHSEELDSLRGFFEEGSREQTTLQDMLASELPRSESALLRSLVLIGQATVADRVREAQYDDAVDAGEIDAELMAWLTASEDVAAALWSSE